MLFRWVLSVAFALAPLNGYSAEPAKAEFLKPVQFGQIFNAIHTTKFLLQVIRSQVSKEEYAQFETEFKKQGVTENTPMPQVMIKGTTIVMGSTTYEFKKWGDISNGKNTWRFNKSKSLFENSVSLDNFFETGAVAGFSIFPEAYAEGNFDKPSKWVLNARIVMTLAVLALMSPLFGVVGIGSGASLMIGVALILAAEDMSTKFVRSTSGVDLVCENGKLKIKSRGPNPQSVSIDKEGAAQHVGVVEQNYQQLICENGSVMAGLGNIVNKMVGSTAVASAVEPSKTNK